jgi:DNA-binding MarR family transcriptional regulator
VTELEQIPDDDLKIGLLLALLQDDAKNQASYLTWQERRAEAKVAPVLRRENVLQHIQGVRIQRAIMSTPLSQRLQQDRFSGPVHAATLNLLIAAGFLRERSAILFAEFGVTPAQYNVLRILKGVYPDGHPRCEIARRLIERAPDLTRMIDRLERRGLVERARSGQDRRHSITRITAQGLELIERMAPTATTLHRIVSRRLTRPEVAALSRLCEKLYAQG